MKKSLVVAAGLILISFSMAGARTWIPDKIQIGTTPFDCGNTPSLVLYNSVQPIVFSDMGNGLRRTPFGWYNYSVGASGKFIASDGKQTIVAGDNLVTYSPNGKFYSSQNSMPKVYQNGAWTNVNSTLPFGSGYGPMAVGADSEGYVYAGKGSELVMTAPNGPVWSQPIDFSGGTGTSFGLNTITDIAVSANGEVAISGSTGDRRSAVVWFDYKSSSWHVRYLAPSNSPENRIGIGWDPEGNLGAAYVNSNMLKFDYLNMETGLWSSEIVLANEPSFTDNGTALAYDRFGNPVIAAGNWLVYDPVVPEPVTLLLMGMGGLACLRTRRCR
jgi:hypothetical protein